jgi:phosphatidate cytidylyltransferase
MNKLNKTYTAILLIITIYLPICYNKVLLRLFSNIILLLCFYELYNNIISKKILSKYNFIFFYWLLFPLIIINFLISLDDLLNIITITTISDILQQISNKLFIKFYKNNDKLNKIMLLNPFPILSPKKTIIGYLGGFLTLLLYYYYNYKFSYILMFYICGCVGDLFASYFKRRIKIDNYSNYLGSHGGFLDRCDAIIFNVHLFFLLSLINKN